MMCMGYGKIRYGRIILISEQDSISVESDTIPIWISQMVSLLRIVWHVLISIICTLGQVMGKG